MNDLKETSRFFTKFSSLNLAPKLKKLFKLSKFPIVATLYFDPAITAGIGMLYAAGEGIINYIEIENMKTFLQEYIERKIDEHLKLEDQAECELVLQSIIKSLRCSKTSQIKRIVDILQETIEYNELKYDEAEDFINVVSELSEREAILLARCYRYFTNHTLSPKFTVRDVEDKQRQLGLFVK